MEDDIWEQFISVPERPEAELDPTETRRRHQFFGIREEEDASLQRAKEVWKRIDAGRNKEISSKWGHTFQVDVEDPAGRFYLVHIPSCILEDLNEGSKVPRPYPVVIFYHGLNSCAWYCALKGTGLRKLAQEKKFIAIFGQGQGEYFESGPKRDKWNCIAFGELYWEIAHPHADFLYLDTILAHIGIRASSSLAESANWPAKYQGRIMIDCASVYFMGYSNGAMFSCNVAIRYGCSVFKGICNMMGGWAGGYPDEGLMDVKEAKYPVPLLLVSGTEDAYLPSCIKARDLFEPAGFPVTVRVLEATSHVYPRDYEEMVWQFFLTAGG